MIRFLPARFLFDVRSCRGLRSHHAASKVIELFLICFHRVQIGFPRFPQLSSKHGASFCEMWLPFVRWMVKDDCVNGTSVAQRIEHRCFLHPNFFSGKLGGHGGRRFNSCRLVPLFLFYFYARRLLGPVLYTGNGVYHWLRSPTSGHSFQRTCFPHRRYGQHP